MTDLKPSTERLDRDATQDSLAALAAHLMRSGVQFLPQPNAESVGRLAAKFGVSPKLSVGSGVDEPSSEPKPQAKPPSIKPQLPAQPVAAVLAPALLDAVGQSYEGDPVAAEDRQTLLEQCSQQVSVCTRCDVLSSCRTKTVFGEGSVTPRVAFFGEGPGADEDRTGRPFVGRAGQLLTKMIEACKFQREDVYIFNTVKCRPPGNRNPEPEEIDQCREYYEQQLAILRPEYIVCLGAVSAQELLKSKLSVGRLRGKLHRYFDSKVLVTYHPAYLLRNPAAKKAAWADLQLMLKDAGINI